MYNFNSCFIIAFVNIQNIIKKKKSDVYAFNLTITLQAGVLY